MLPNQVPVSFFAGGSKLLQDFGDLRQGRPFNERNASSASSALSLVLRLASTADLFRLHRVSDLSWLAHRLLAPPPQNSFDALCSRQI